MNRICKCLDKENEEVNANAISSNLKFKWILAQTNEELPSGINSCH